MSNNTDFFESLQVGTEVPPLVKHVTKKQLIMYSASTWDFHPSHYDTGFAKSQGIRDVYADGAMSAAFMAQLVTDWIGVRGVLKKLTLTYRTMVFPNDTVTCTGNVTRKYVKEGARFLECAIISHNQENKVVAQGSATVSLFPDRAGNDCP